MQAIIHARVITPYRTIEDGTILWEKDKITAVLQGVPPVDVETFDANGLYASPGFIDMHTHGAGGFAFMSDDPSDVEKAAFFQAEHGVTAMLAGYHMPAHPNEHLCSAIRAFEKVIPVPDGPELLGIYFEGPYFAESLAGKQEVSLPNSQEYKAILNTCPHLMRWALAPELPGAMELIDELRCRGIAPSLGHSEADYDCVVEAFERGCCSVTHLYSGMTMVHREDGVRLVGTVESAFLLNGMLVETIANGAHLTPELFRLIYQIKGAASIVLVTDSSPFAGMPDGMFTLDGESVRAENGVIKSLDGTGFRGSVATIDQLVRMITRQAGISLSDAVRMASTNPAAALGAAARKGVLAPAYDADIVLFDEQIDMHFVCARGRIIKNRL